MSYYRFKVKINDYFPKIDAIPFDYYICVISCDNASSKIKLSEYKYQYFQHAFKLTKNTDLLFNFKLINYLDANTLVGIYDLLIPYTKINQIIQRDSSYYQQQIKLIMNSNVKIKLFGTMMNITSIYLDLIFEISLAENNTPSINKLRIYDILGNNSYGELMKNNNNNRKIENKNINYNKIKYSKSPNLNYNSNNNTNYLYEFFKDETNDEKEIINNESDDDQCNNIYNQKHSDINYNVMNNNYLNYFQIDNNNYPLDYKFKISHMSPINYPKNFSNIKNMNNFEKNSNNKIKKQNLNLGFKSTKNINSLNNIPIPKGKTYINIKNNNIKGSQRKTNKSRSPFLMNSERNNYLDGRQSYTRNSLNKNLTEVKNSIESNIIRTEKKKLELNQYKNNYKFQNTDNKSNKNNIIHRFNYIKKNKPFLYDKKYHIEKYVNHRLIKKIPNSKKKLKNSEQLKIDNLENNIKMSGAYQNIILDFRIKTPKKKYLNSNLNDESSINISNIKEFATDLNLTENDKIKIDNNKRKINISNQNSNSKNMKKYYIADTDSNKNTKININFKENENNNEDIANYNEDLINYDHKNNNEKIKKNESKNGNVNYKENTNNKEKKNNIGKIKYSKNIYNNENRNQINIINKNRNKIEKKDNKNTYENTKKKDTEYLKYKEDNENKIGIINKNENIFENNKYIEKNENKIQNENVNEKENASDKEKNKNSQNIIQNENNRDNQKYFENEKMNKNEGVMNNNSENKNIIENDELNKKINDKSNIINENNPEMNNINSLIIYNSEEVKNKLIQFLNINIKLTKEIKEKMNLNKKIFTKLLLCKEKYYTE